MRIGVLKAQSQVLWEAILRNRITLLTRCGRPKLLNLQTFATKLSMAALKPNACLHMAQTRNY